MAGTIVELRGRGMRGEGFPSGVRRTGAYGAAPADSDATVFQKFANWAILANPNFKGDKGDPGANVMAISLFTIASTLNVPVGTDLVQTSGHTVKGVGFARYAQDDDVDAAYVADHPLTSFISNNGRGFKLAEDIVTIQMCGGVCDGVALDTDAAQAAVATGKTVYMPYGTRILIDAPLKLNDGQVFFGCGKSAWEPYIGAGNPFPPVVKTEIIVDGAVAFDCRGLVAPSVSGLSIRSVAGQQSNYGALAAYQAGAIGFDITDCLHFEAHDVSFFGLEAGVHIDPEVTRSAQMPRISDWIASDCGTVFRFGDETSVADAIKQYVARDVRIADCMIALHCDKYFEIHTTDGFRAENCRLFPGHGKSIYIRNTPYVSLIGVTTFESTDDSLTLEDCEGVTIAGLQVSRTGAYANGLENFIFCTAVVLKNCIGVEISGTIRQPCGKAMQIEDCQSVNVNVSIATPFWTKGSLFNGGGAIDVYGSSYVNVNASFNQEETYNILVYADADSGETLSGSVTGPLFAGTVRALGLQQQRTLKYRYPTNTEISPGGAVEFIMKRVKIPPNCIMRSRSVSITQPGFILRGAFEGNAVFWNTTSPEPYGGSLSLQDLPLYDNRGQTEGYKDVSLLIYNNTSGPITLVEGAEVNISYGFDLA